jgi:hypothetical protein
VHKGEPIQNLASEGADFADEDPYQDWMVRSRGGPRPIQAKIVPMVQVVLDYMGSQKQMCVRKNLSKAEFLSMAKSHLGTTHNLDAIPLGLDAWEIRAVCTYDVRETRKLTLKCQKLDGSKFTISLPGTAEIEDMKEACRRKWNFEPWISVTIKREDDKPFFLQDGAKYSVITQYDPDLDPRLEIKLRIDLSDRSYVIDKTRIENDPAKVLKELSDKYGFPSVRATQVRFAPETPWVSGQTICVTFRTAISCANVRLEQLSRREFTLHIADEPWESGEVLLPSSFRKDQIWAHLQTLHSIPDVSQFQVVAGSTDISKRDEWPSGRIEAVPFKFPVKWHIEDPTQPTGLFEYEQKEMTPLITAKAALDLLHH